MIPPLATPTRSSHPWEWRKLAALAVALVAIAVLCRLYVGAEDGSYFWDWVGYFHAFQQTAADFHADPGGTLAKVIRTVREDDYNLAAVAPLLPAADIAGATRVTYVTALAILYLLPAAYLATRLARRTGEAFAPVTLFAGALLYWPIWMATLRGMPDVAGLLPLGAATLLALQTRFLTEARLRSAVGFGFLVWSAFLIRRWYAYSCLSLEALTFAFAVARLYRETDQAAAARRFAERYLVNILALLAALAVLQGPLARRIVETNYADVYAAYQQPLGATLALVVGQLGLIATVAVAAGLLRAIRTRNETVLFTAALAFLSGGLFLRVQAPGLHHQLPFYFWLFPAFAFGVAWPWTTFRGAAPLGKSLSLAALSAAAFASMYLPNNWRMDGVGLLPDRRLPPLRVEHPAAYAALIHDLTAISAGRRIAVFASSPALNPSRLGAMSADIHQRLVPVAEVDRRDGFYLPALAADVAVVPSAPATHLVPSGQRVVTLPAHWILAREGPGQAYERASGPYDLDDGVRAFIYLRRRPLSAEDTAAVAADFRAIYPDWIMTHDGPGPK